MTEKKQRGRPPLAPVERGQKTPIRNLRVPKPQWEAWQAAAKSLGLSLSDWVRDTLDKAAAKVRKKTPKE